MKNIYHSLTLHDLREGVEIYCRLSASFWMNYFVGLIMIFLGTFSVFHHLLVIQSRPWLIVLVSVIIFSILIPGLIKATRAVDLKLESRELRGEYLMLAPLDRLNRGIVVVATAVVIYLFASGHQTGLWPLFIFLMILLVSALIAIAIYGWMAHQFKDN